MKTELKAKFLQHLLAKKKANEGFTLVELLVVVIIIGILAAIALPSMLNQASRARLAGAQTQAGAINRAQQAYRLEASRFANNETELNIGNPSAQGYTFAFTNGTSQIGQVLYTADDTATDKNVRGCATSSATGVTQSTINVSATAGGPPAACSP